MGILVDGIVAMRNKQPYVRLHLDGIVLGQMSMAEARDVAHNILTMCARTEADAMIHKFFDHNGYPAGAGAALMVEFRAFRFKLDMEPVGKSVEDPDAKPEPKQ